MGMCETDKRTRIRVHRKRKVIGMKVFFELEFEVLERGDSESCKAAMKKLTQDNFVNVEPALFAMGGDGFDYLELWRDGLILEACGGRFYCVP